MAYTAWVRRAAAHPLVAQALAAGEISESFARTLCQWTGKLPEDCLQDADEILLLAAKSGADLRDLAGLAGEIYARSLPDDPDKKRDQAFEERSVRLETTFDGAGVLHGDLTPECAAVVGTVLDALSAPAGAEDTRTHAQRCHDALQEAMQRLVTAGLLPERAGQPVKVWAHISLADLMVLDGSSALLEEWTARVRAQWAGHRAEASAGGGDGGAWLDGDAAGAMACDAAMAPFVTGEVNPDALEDLVRLCVDLDRLRHHPRTGQDGTGGGGEGDGTGGGGQDAPASGTTLAWEALERAIIGKAVDLVSGPGGLASFLRRRQLGARLAGPSLPLDIGYSETIPAAIRNAVTLRDRHCQWAGRCNQPAAACEVAPRQAQGERRQDQRSRLCSIVLVPPSGCDSPVGLDPGPEPGRDHHGVEPGQDEGTAQPRAASPPRVTPRLGLRAGSPGGELIVQGAVAHQAVSRGHQDGLQDAVAARQCPGGDACLLAVEQGGAGPDGQASVHRRSFSPDDYCPETKRPVPL